MPAMANGARAADGSSLLIGDEAFGHTRSGGSVGFIDPAHALSFGDTMNRLGRGPSVNRRGHAPIDAAYRAVAHPTAPGRHTITGT
jgi:CubicO group peptidase (beta-lactamase class C family)